MHRNSGVLIIPKPGKAPPLTSDQGADQPWISQNSSKCSSNEKMEDFQVPKPKDSFKSSSRIKSNQFQDTHFKKDNFIQSTKPFSVPLAQNIYYDSSSSSEGEESPPVNENDSIALEEDDSVNEDPSESSSDSGEWTHVVRHRRAPAPAPVPKSVLPPNGKAEPCLLYESESLLVVYKPPFWHCSDSLLDGDETSSTKQTTLSTPPSTLPSNPPLPSLPSLPPPSLAPNPSWDRLVESNKVESLHDYVYARWRQKIDQSVIHDRSLQRGHCHRLDRDTSGPLIIARTANAWRYIRLHQRLRTLAKEYIALVHNVPPTKVGILDSPLRRDGKYMVTDSNGMPSLTCYVTLGTFEDKKNPRNIKQYSLLWVRIITGRTHQIRTHLSSINCPLVCDSGYAANYLKSDSEWCERLFLHCQLLSFPDPSCDTNDRKYVSVVSALPEDLRSALMKCGEYTENPDLPLNCKGIMSRLTTAPLVTYPLDRHSMRTLRIKAKSVGGYFLCSSTQGEYQNRNYYRPYPPRMRGENAPSEHESIGEELDVKEQSKTTSISTVMTNIPSPNVSSHTQNLRPAPCSSHSSNNLDEKNHKKNAISSSSEIIDGCPKEIEKDNRNIARRQNMLNHQILDASESAPSFADEPYRLPGSILRTISDLEKRFYLDPAVSRLLKHLHPHMIVAVVQKFGSPPILKDETEIEFGFRCSDIMWKIICSQEKIKAEKHRRYNTGGGEERREGGRGGYHGNAPSPHSNTTEGASVSSHPGYAGHGSHASHLSHASQGSHGHGHHGGHHTGGHHMGGYHQGYHPMSGSPHHGNGSHQMGSGQNGGFFPGGNGQQNSQGGNTYAATGLGNSGYSQGRYERPEDGATGNNFPRRNPRYNYDNNQKYRKFVRNYHSTKSEI